MSTIKTDRIDFEKLLNGLDPIESTVTGVTGTNTPVQQNVVPAPVVQPSVSSVVDNTSSEDIMNAKMFEYNYDATKKGIRKKARKTILNMVKHIIPDDIIEEDYIQDKIEQDIETLTGLYMQIENNTIMQRSLMESVAKGNAMPRMYEVFAQLTEKLQKINEQIVTTEQKIRKTYIDIKYEVRDKMNENASSPALIGSDTKLGIEGGGIIVTNSKDLINEVKRKKIEALKNAKETKYEEE